MKYLRLSEGVEKYSIRVETMKTNKQEQMSNKSKYNNIVQFV